MNRYVSATALAIALLSAPAAAQQDLSSTSGSNAEAASGSISGAISDQAQAQTMNGNVGVSHNENTSTSQSGAVSGSASESDSLSLSDQSQGQAQSNDSDLTASQTNMQGQQAVNEQGVTVNQTWNTQPLRRTYVGTNAAVPLAASSSFSSDYCGGTASVGASAAPIGISVGGNKPVFDKSCQSLRRAEKFGMAAANAHNMQQPALAGQLMSMMIWSICTSDSDGAGIENPTAQACEMAGLLSGGGSPGLPPVTYIAPPEPQPEVTPEYAPPADNTYSDVPPDSELYKTPRGAVGDEEEDPLAELSQRHVEPIASVDPDLFAASVPRMP